MPDSRTFRSGLIASLLLCVAFSSLALTLGRSRGVALIGRPLDLAVALTLDSPAQANDLCPEADVFHGDTRVDGGRITLRVDSAGGSDAVLRLRSTLPVDEPVVTIYLRLGCAQKFTRRYVLLSEEPGELPLSPTPQPSFALPVPLPQSAQPQTPAAAPSGRGGGQRGRGGRSRTAADAEVAASRTRADSTAPQASIAARVPAPSSSVGRPERALTLAPASRSERRSQAGSRLQVDLLDFAPERNPQLRASMGLAGLPSTSEQVRAEAVALWRSLNAQPEDILRDVQRVQALEADVKGLRGLVAGNDRTLGELRGQLEQVRQERTLTLAAIALLALLLAAVIVTWWLRRGERSGAEWWRRDPAPEDSALGPIAPQAPLTPVGPAVRAREMDLRVDESMFESLKASARATVAARVIAPAKGIAAPTTAKPAEQHSTFQSSQVASMRMVKAEELVDIQQQADFFMSLGQTEQAIQVLESHIQNNQETSALVWLDLLAIYRALKRGDAYETLRAEFQRVFNAAVPSYDSTPTVSGGLEDYPRALSRISALWPSPKVLDVIEESIFRKPGGTEGKPFDLEAYRELVMLYNLGREVVQAGAVPGLEPPRSDSPKSRFYETSMQPLSAAAETSGWDHSAPGLAPGEAGDTDIPLDFESMLIEEEGDARTTLSYEQDPQVPRASPRLGLDIDLSGPEPKRRAAAPVADPNSIDFQVFEPGTGGAADGVGKP